MNIDMTQIRGAADIAAQALGQARTAALIEVANIIADAAEAITGPASDAERASWGPKEAAARAYALNPTDTDALAVLTPEAEVTGEDIADLAKEIVKAAKAHEDAAPARAAAMGRITGLHRVARWTIDAAKTPEDAQAAVAALEKALAG